MKGIEIGDTREESGKRREERGERRQKYKGGEEKGGRKCRLYEEMARAWEIRQDQIRPDQTGEKKEREKIGAIENMGEGRNKVRDDRRKGGRDGWMEGGRKEDKSF